MKHHTENPAERAISVACRAAGEQFKKDHDIQNYFKAFDQILHESLKEFVEEEMYITNERR
jgi:hypothetical protein